MAPHQDEPVRTVWDHGAIRVVTLARDRSDGEDRLSLVELLEREGPLAALTKVREEAAEGRGSMVLVTGEPGIGKTVLHFGLLYHPSDLFDEASSVQPAYLTRHLLP